LEQSKHKPQWPATIDKFDDAERQASAESFWDELLTSRPVVEWAKSDLVLLAEYCRMSVLIAEVHKDLEREGVYDYTDKGKKVRSASLDVLSMLQGSRAQLLGKLRLATSVEDKRTSQGQAKKMQQAVDDIEQADDLIARPN
jgi:hypothetical protein